LERLRLAWIDNEITNPQEELDYLQQLITQENLYNDQS